MANDYPKAVFSDSNLHGFVKVLGSEVYQGVVNDADELKEALANGCRKTLEKPAKKTAKKTK